MFDSRMYNASHLKYVHLSIAYTHMQTHAQHAHVYSFFTV